MTTGALLFLLAVAAGQVDPDLSSVLQSEVTLKKTDPIISCPIKFYGKPFTKVEVLFHPDSSVAFCFNNLPYETTQDCLLVDNCGGATTFTLSENKMVTGPGSDLHAALPSITSSSTCYVQLSLQDENVTYIELRLYDFSLKTAMEVKTFNAYTQATIDVRTKIGNLSIDSWSFGSTVAQSGVYEDISGCRQAGVFIPSYGSIRNPEACSVSICDSEMDVWVIQKCNPSELCMGNNTCILPASVCTVTGSTVIDFFNRVHSVPDRCVYRLMGTLALDFQIYAGFRERHLKDVPFLDHLIIFVKATSVWMYLEQGGRVRVGDKILKLSTMAQLLYGVELSKDQTGVTAKLPSSKTTVHFDGNTAHVTGSDEPLNGLCGDPTDESQTLSLSGWFDSYFSSAGCEIQHSDAINRTVDCSHSTDLCDLMNQAPFTACHDHIDPEPYIAACTNTSCKYTPVDDLPCRYMEAYTKACSLKDDVTVEDWRSKAGCSAALQASCLDQYCSDHEFCGQKLGEARCLCRALFASKYQSTDTLAEPTVCMHSSANVTLAECLL